MWVVKLGGSLYDSPRLRDWLEVLCDARDPVAIVPGGGPFADQVREAQARWGFDGPTAHRMALRAMDQFGDLLCGLRPGLPAASRVDDLAGILRRSPAVVWQPAVCDPPVEPSWRITSDSLAAWLASTLGASGLALVKSAAPRSAARGYSAPELERLLDEGFDGYRRALACPVLYLHRDQVDEWRDRTGTPA